MTTPATRPLWHDATGEPAVATQPAGVLWTLPVPDVVVVGLGASGLAAVVELAAAGARVVGLDAVGIGGAAAGANGGLLLGGLADFHHVAVARHGRDVATHWYRATLAELARTYDEEPTARRTGSLRSAADEAEAADLRAHGAALRRDGIAVEDLRGPLGPALLLPDDGVLDPLARCRRLARRAVDAGARLLVGARARVDGATLAVAGRRVAARAVLVAVDGGLEETVPALRDEVVTWRLQMLATGPQSRAVLGRPLYHRWGLDYAQQLPDGRLAVGGGRDLEGPAARRGAPVPTGIVQDHLDRFVDRLGGAATVTHRWASASAWTDLRLPVDRELAPGVHVVGAHSGHGNVLGGLLARAAAGRLLEHLASRGRG